MRRRLCAALAASRCWMTMPATAFPIAHIRPSRTAKTTRVNMASPRTDPRLMNRNNIPHPPRFASPPVHLFDQIVIMEDGVVEPHDNGICNADDYPMIMLYYKSNNNLSVLFHQEETEEKQQLPGQKTGAAFPSPQFMENFAKSLKLEEKMDPNNKAMSLEEDTTVLPHGTSPPALEKNKAHVVVEPASVVDEKEPVFQQTLANEGASSAMSTTRKGSIEVTLPDQAMTKNITGKGDDKDAERIVGANMTHTRTAVSPETPMEHHSISGALPFPLTMKERRERQHQARANLLVDQAPPLDQAPQWTGANWASDSINPTTATPPANSSIHSGDDSKGDDNVYDGGEKPWFSLDIQHNVPAEAIQGAALVSVVLQQALLNSGSHTASDSIATTLAAAMLSSFLAITRSRTGDGVRLVGKLTWNAGATLVREQQELRDVVRGGLELWVLFCRGCATTVKTTSQWTTNAIQNMTSRVADTYAESEANRIARVRAKKIERDTLLVAKRKEAEARSLFKTRLALETKERERQKQKAESLRVEMEEREERERYVKELRRKRAIEVDERRSIMECRLALEATERKQRALAKAELFRRKLLETRLKIEAVERERSATAMKRAQLEDERLADIQRRQVEREKLEEKERERKFAVEAERKRVEQERLESLQRKKEMEADRMRSEREGRERLLAAAEKASLEQAAADMRVGEAEKSVSEKEELQRNTAAEHIRLEEESLVGPLCKKPVEDESREIMPPAKAQSDQDCLADLKRTKPVNLDSPSSQEEQYSDREDAQRAMYTRVAEAARAASSYRNSMTTHQRGRVSSALKNRSAAERLAILLICSCAGFFADCNELEETMGA